MSDDIDSVTAFDRAETEMTAPLSDRIIKAVAAKQDVDPLSLNPPLYDVVDPDALDSLAQSQGTWIKFTWVGCQIEIDERGTITVSDE